MSSTTSRRDYRDCKRFRKVCSPRKSYYMPWNPITLLPVCGHYDDSQSTLHACSNDARVSRWSRLLPIGIYAPSYLNVRPRRQYSGCALFGGYSWPSRSPLTETTKTRARQSQTRQDRWDHLGWVVENIFATWAIEIVRISVLFVKRLDDHHYDNFIESILFSKISN